MTSICRHVYLFCLSQLALNLSALVFLNTSCFRCPSVSKAHALNTKVPKSRHQAPTMPLFLCLPFSNRLMGRSRRTWAGTVCGVPARIESDLRHISTAAQIKLPCCAAEVFVSELINAFQSNRIFSKHTLLNYV